MSERVQDDRALNRLEELDRALSNDAAAHIKQLLATLNPAEIGHLLDSLPRTKRYVVWQLVDAQLQGEILSHVNDEVRVSLIEVMESDALLKAATIMDIDDLVDIFNDLPETVTDALFNSMSQQDRRRLESILSYPENSAGGLMDIDIVTIRPNVTLDVVLRYLRMRGQLPQMTDSLNVVNRNDKLIGSLPLSILLTTDPGQMVADVMEPSNHALLASTMAKEITKHFQLHDLVSVPVVDESNQLLGRITIDDIVDVIRDEADQDFMRMAGLSERGDLFAPLIPSASKRGIWLGINLITALMASWVVGLYEATLDQIVALAILMPIVVSMGGIAGSQTLTLVIRSLALGQMTYSTTWLLLLKEVAIGALNGMIWAMVLAGIAYLWFGDKHIGLVIAIALLINMVFATLSGLTIPLLLKKINIDPALAGSVLLTTITDIAGFVAFLGLATWWLL